MSCTAFGACARIESAPEVGRFPSHDASKPDRNARSTLIFDEKGLRMTEKEPAEFEERLPREAKVGTVVTGEPKNVAKDTSRNGHPAGGKRSPGPETSHLAPTGQHGSRAGEHASGFQRTMGAIRTVIPIVQKVLPLLDGNVALAVANLLVPRLQAPTVDLHPVEESVARMREELTGLRDGITSHETALGRMGEQLESVKDSLERSAAHQKELAEDLQRVQKRMTALSVVGLILLVASIAANAWLLVRVGQSLH